MSASSQQTSQTADTTRSVSLSGGPSRLDRQIQLSNQLNTVFLGLSEMAIGQYPVFITTNAQGELKPIYPISIGYDGSGCFEITTQGETETVSINSDVDVSFCGIRSFTKDELPKLFIFDIKDVGSAPDRLLAACYRVVLPSSGGNIYQKVVVSTNERGGPTLDLGINPGSQDSAYHYETKSDFTDLSAHGRIVAWINGDQFDSIKEELKGILKERMVFRSVNDGVNCSSFKGINASEINAVTPLAFPNTVRPSEAIHAIFDTVADLMEQDVPPKKAIALGEGIIRYATYHAARSWRGYKASDQELGYQTVAGLVNRGLLGPSLDQENAWLMGPLCSLLVSVKSVDKFSSSISSFQKEKKASNAGTGLAFSLFGTNPEAKKTKPAGVKKPGEAGHPGSSQTTRKGPGPNGGSEKTVKRREQRKRNKSSTSPQAMPLPGASSTEQGGTSKATGVTSNQDTPQKAVDSKEEQERQVLGELLKSVKIINDRLDRLEQQPSKFSWFGKSN